MKAKLYDKTGKEKGTINLPKNFSSKIREDILLKVFEAQKIKQSMGSKIKAGAGYSASGILKHRRHVWKTTYGKGISRVPRKIMSRHGASFNWIGATVTSARGGRRAHPPKSIENQFKKINKKELRIAINSALAGTIDEKAMERKYGKKMASGIIFDGKISELKTKEILKIFKNIFGSLEKVLKKKAIRAGKGKTRGRKYKSNAGLLVVISDEETLKLSGVDVVNVGELEISDLAPNGEPGRLTGYTEKAIKQLGESLK